MSPSSRSKALLNARVPPFRQITHSAIPRTPLPSRSLLNALGAPTASKYPSVVCAATMGHSAGAGVQQIVEPASEQPVSCPSRPAHHSRPRCPAAIRSPRRVRSGSVSSMLVVSGAQWTPVHQ